MVVAGIVHQPTMPRDTGLDSGAGFVGLSPGDVNIIPARSVVITSVTWIGLPEAQLIFGQRLFERYGVVIGAGGKVQENETCTKRPIRAVLFDLDDTLYDRNALFARWAEGYIHDVLGIGDQPSRRALLDRLATYNADGYGSNMPAIEELCRITAEAEGGKPDDIKTEAARLFHKFVEQWPWTCRQVLLTRMERMDASYGIVQRHRTSGGATGTTRPYRTNRLSLRVRYIRHFQT